MLSVLRLKKIGIHRITRLGNVGLKYEIGHVTHQSKKIYTLRGEKCKNRPAEPKTEFGVQNIYSRYIYLSILFTIKNELNSKINKAFSFQIYFWGQEGKNKASELKNGT
jgi:hypothetical protein